MKPLVYLVDDNIEFCKLMEVSLNGLGVEFQYFATIPDYMVALDQKKPVLSLVDLNFGSEDLGFQVISQVREHVDVSHPIIVISGKKDVHSINYALELGANDYVVKPLDQAYFVEKISQYFRTDQMQEWSSPDVELAEGNNEAFFTLNAEISSIDEMGVRFETKHLIAKGTTIHLNSKVFEEILGKRKSPVLTILSSRPVENGQGYEIYAEISLANDEVTRNIRNWISNKTKMAA